MEIVRSESQVATLVLSPFAQQAIAPILKSGRACTESMAQLVGTAKALCTKNDPSSVQLFITQVKGVTEAVRGHINLMKQTGPTQQACNEAIERISANVSELDSLLLEAAYQNFVVEGQQPTTSHDHTVKEFIAANTKSLGSVVDIVAQLCTESVAKPNDCDFAQLSSSVQQLAMSFLPVRLIQA
jgi:hypothetical protein